MKKDDLAVKRSSGNVFADLGLADSDNLLMKGQIVVAIGNIIREQGLTQITAAEKIGVRQPDVSKILDGRFDGFSLERLLGFLVLLGNKVTIEVEPANENTTPGTHLVFAHA